MAIQRAALTALLAAAAILAACGSGETAATVETAAADNCRPEARTGSAPMPDGVNVAYWVEGCGPAVVMLHSTFMNSRQWDELTRQLAGSYQVIRYDVAAHGGTAAPPKPRPGVDELRAVLDAVGVRRAAMIGSSMGGGIALDFALTDPDRVSRLVLSGAAPSGAKPEGEDGKAIGDIFRATAKDGVAAGVEKWVEHPINRRAGQATREQVAKIASGSPAIFKATEFPITPIDPPAIGRLAEVKAPTLIIVGTLDSPGLMRAARTMSTTIPGARLDIFENSAHFPSLDEPERFRRLVVDFLAPEKSAAK